MSILTYNGITFGPECWLTLSFEKEAVYDSSETDLMYTRITITGSGILTPKIQPISSGDDPGQVEDGGQLLNNDDPASAFNKLTTVNQFYQPRKRLSFTVNGVEMIPANAVTNNTADAKNGPEPVYFNLRQLATAAFAFELKIVSHWAEASALSEGGKVVSHRWTETADIDQNFFTTKTRTGKIVVSSSSFGFSGNQIDGLRETLITCSIAPGFVRLNSTYTLAESGLEMSYSHKDQEVYRQMPFPATEAHGKITIRAQLMGSPGRQAMCQVMLKGPKRQEANPLALVKLATAIAFTRLRNSGTFYAQQAKFHQRLYQNEVDVNITGMLVQPVAKGAKQEKRTFTLLAGVDSFGKPIFGTYQTTKPPDPGTRGTANVLLHAAAWQDPTLKQTLNKQGNFLTVQGPTFGMLTGTPGN